MTEARGRTRAPFVRGAFARGGPPRSARRRGAIVAPFAGIVAERLVGVGDYVSPGTRVATIVRIDPVRVELTIPEHAVSVIKDGQQVRLEVDAYPGQEFSARLTHISPALRADQRALTVEAIASNPDGRLKPGLFATAAIRQRESVAALLVPATAVETTAGTSRVYVVLDGSRVEERIVTTGDKIGGLVEVTSGLSAGAVVALEPNGRLTDGAAVRMR